jgi:hypothetical protein
MNFSFCYRLAMLCVFGVVTFAAPAALQPVWHVRTLKATIIVNPDSSLLVDQTQIIPENSDRNFGLRCQIPIGDEDRWDRNYGPGYTDDNGLRVKVQKVTVDGQPVAFHLDHYRHATYQLIVGKEDRRYTVAPGEHELHVIYRVTGALRWVGNRDELYWNVVGHTPMAFDSLRVRVYLPSAVPGESLHTSAYAGGRGVSDPRSTSDPPIETTKLSNGAEFNIADLHSSQSLSLIMRWPQGYVHRPSFGEQFGSPYYLAPLLLLVIYISARRYLRRNMEDYSTAPQYEPPAGLSAAALRYVMRGGVDGTSLAASLASLTVRGYVEAQAKSACYAFWRTGKCDTDLGKLPVEEAGIAQLLFDASANVADPACGKENDFQDLMGLTAEPSTSGNGRTAAVSFGPTDPRLNVLVGAMYTRLKPQLEGKYFTWNAWIALLGMLATLIFGVMVVLSAGQETGSLFLAFWSFGFFQTFSALMGLSLLGRQRKPVAAAVVSLAFIGATLLAARELARDISWVPVASYIAMIVVNGIFLPLLRTPTTEGQKLLSQIRGYKDFLEATERDRLTELGKTPASMPKLASLPYAIALDVTEPWGDAMADSFASTTTCL